jgi:hypothetical protein
MSNDIDFVLPWVDGNDKAWQAEKRKYASDDSEGNSAVRFRDWGLLPYWFRGVEKHASWVRKVHFVTCGHYPEWLNLKHPKLNFVKHSDYMPQEYLPTFNSAPIELNFHRISSLSDKFVLFNDDFFITKNISQRDFFKGDLPCDQAIMDCIAPTMMFSYIRFNNTYIINKYFQKRKVLGKNFLKWYNPIYGFQCIRNILLFPWMNFTDIYAPHLPIPYVKRNFQEVWEVEGQLLDKTSRNKFRSKDDVLHWLFRYFRIMKSEFNPSPILGKYYDISSDNTAIINAIKKQKHKTIAINDLPGDFDFAKAKNELINAFESVLPNKSEFEI